MRSAEGAIQFAEYVLNPRDNARRNRRRAFAESRGTLPEMCGWNGALFADRYTATRHRPDSALPKMHPIRAAMRTRDNAYQAF